MYRELKHLELYILYIHLCLKKDPDLPQNLFHDHFSINAYQNVSITLSNALLTHQLTLMKLYSIFVDMRVFIRLGKCYGNKICNGFFPGPLNPQLYLLRGKHNLM